MGFKCGIVGLPNVGKSTLFNALTQAQVPAANYPFCTIDPNVRNVYVPDPRLNQLANIVKPEKILPTTIQFVDIAGLVAGASKGEGLGNQFLAHIRETDAIAHVVRCFTDKDITHVTGSIDPIRDIEIIQMELALADLQTVTNAEQKNQKAAKAGDKEAKLAATVYEKLIAHLNQGLMLRTLTLNQDEAAVLDRLHLITTKPTLYIANIAENDALDGPLISQVKAFAAKENAEVVPICCAFEADLISLPENERDEFLKDSAFGESGLARVIHAGYQLLNLLTFFTAGPKEVHAWTVHQGASAPQAAGCIHTDFEKGFIRAEVIGFGDYIQYGGEQGAKDAGRLRLEGKDYLIHDGDIVHFRFNVSK